MTKQYTTSTARAAFADIVSRAEYAGERTIVHRRKKPVAAIVPVEDLECLRRLEDEIDLAAARKAIREKGENIPWSVIKKEFKFK